MNARHLSTEERAVLAKLVDDCGPAEPLRVLATLIANRMDYTELAEAARTSLLKVARDIDPNFTLASILSSDAPRKS